MSGLILFIEGHAPVEIEATATCKDLYKVANVGRNFLTFQGQKLPRDSTPLADTGISSQCMLGVKSSVSIVLVKFDPQDAQFEAVWGDDSIWVTIILETTLIHSDDRLFELYIHDLLTGKFEVITWCKRKTVKSKSIKAFIRAFIDANPTAS